MKYDNDLFYTCSLIEYIGRQQKLKRSDVVLALGEEAIGRIYRYADVFHCEMIEKTANEFIEELAVPSGVFDNVGVCRYEVPDYWTIGEVYERLIEDVAPEGEENPLPTLKEVYTSWIDGAISNYNSDFFYQPRDYLRECYLAGAVLA